MDSLVGCLSSARLDFQKLGAPCTEDDVDAVYIANVPKSGARMRHQQAEAVVLDELKRSDQVVVGILGRQLF